MKTRTLACGGLAVALSLAATSPSTAAPSQACDTATNVAIGALVNEYEFRLDHAQNDSLAALFTPDGVFDSADTGIHLVGRDAIAAYYAKRASSRTTRHISTNLRLVCGGGPVQGWRTLTYYAGDGEAPYPATANSVAEYQETFKKGSDGQWRFATRQAHAVFGVPPKLAAMQKK